MPGATEAERLTPAVLYAAKSTLDPRGSIPTQRADCLEMAEREGWGVVGDYADEAASGWSDDRGSDLAAAMQHAEREAPSVLVVQHSDRLARGDGLRARHLGEIYFWALKAGVELRSVQDDSTFTNPLLTFAMGERNAEDSRRKSLAVAAGMKRHAQEGKANGGPRPYGYIYQDGLLVIIEAEAVIVRRIFAEAVAGRSLTAIARDLHSDGVPTLRGRHWRVSTVRGILRNPKYKGRVRHNGETFPGVHEPILDEETFQRAEALLAAVPSRRGRRPKGPHLFRNGMFRCECGEAMVPRTKGGHEYYYCNGRQKLGADFCGMKSVRRAEVDTAVYRYFEQVGLDVEATRLQLADVRDRKLAEVSALRHQAEQEAHRAEERLARVRRDYTDGKLDAADWASFRDQLTGEVKAAKAEAHRLRQSQDDVECDGAMLDAEQEMLEQLGRIRRTIAGEITDAAGADAVRAALSRLFSTFVLHPQQNPRYTGKGRAELVDVADTLMIELVVHERALVGYDERLFPILRREPLHQAENKERIGLPIR